jgi:Pyruvate/2-oxoacid:ferredoxin oxidoreductase delta subunit
LILLATTGLAVAHQVGGTIKPVGVDALCPFGGVETAWKLLAAGGLLQKIAASSVVLLIMTVLLALVFGRAFCGYLCPLGALQEFVGKLRRLLGMRRPLEVPEWVDRYARLLKYVVLVGFTAATWAAAELVIRPYDPWVAWTHLTSTELLSEFSVGLGVLVLSLVGSVVYDRFFCKYLCPMGAVLGLASKVSIFRIRRDAETCTDCHACDRVCPSNIRVSQAETVTSAECLACNECANACPVPGTLAMRAGDPERATGMKPNAVALSVLGIALVTIALATASGNFAWAMPSAADAVNATAGTIDVGQIRGSMTFEEVAQATGIPGSAFEERFGVTPADMTKPMKDVAGTYGFDVHTDVRQFVAEKFAELQATGAAGTAGTSRKAAGED